MSKSIKFDGDTYIDFSDVAFSNGAWHTTLKDALFMQYGDFDANTVYCGIRYAGNNPTNFPAGQYGHLLAFGYNYYGNQFQVTQIATNQQGTELWFRKGMNGEWYDWHKVALSS